jgi:hypothetical protein
MLNRFWDTRRWENAEMLKADMPKSEVGGRRSERKAEGRKQKATKLQLSGLRQTEAAV